MRIITRPNPFSAKYAESHGVWRDGITVVDLLPTEWVGRPDVVVHRNGRRASLIEELNPNDHIVITVIPGDPSGGIGTALTLLSIAGAAVSLIGALTQSTAKRERGDERSPTYDFGGISNGRNEGDPIGVAYGRMRVGGQIINQFVRGSGSSGNATYFGQVSVGEGPIRSIGGVILDTPDAAPLTNQAGTLPSLIEVDGNPATNLQNVAAWIRLGSNEQSAVAQFDQAVQNFAISSELNAPTTTAQIKTFGDLQDSYTISSFTPTAADDPTWDEFGVGYDLNGDLYDGVRFRVQFQSLINYEDDGDAKNALVAFALRYIELDGGGQPITTGGDLGDGWIRPPIFEPIAARSTSSVSYDFEVTTFDPQTWTAPQPGNALSMTDNGTATNTNQTIPAQWGANPGDPVQAFSIECWVRPLNNPNEDDQWNSAGQPLERAIFSWRDGTSDGFWFGFSRVTYQVTPGLQEPWVVPFVKTFGASTFHPQINEGFGEPTPLISSGRPVGVYQQLNWQHVAFTYEADVNGFDDRARIYHNGQLVHEIVTPIGLTSAGLANDFELGAGFETLFQFDELLCYQRELTPAEVAARFNGGQGEYFALSGIAAVTSGVHVGYHFDEASSPFLSFTNQGPLTANDIVTSSVDVIQGKIVQNDPGNVRKRARWRIQMLRASQDSINSGTQDDASVIEVAGLVDGQFRYPNTASYSVRVPADEQLSGSNPTLTTEIEGRLVPVWDGASSSDPVFIKTYTANPAWVAVDIALDKRYGAGRYFTDPSQIDVLAFQDLANRCDELIWDNRATRKTGNSSVIGSADWDGMFYEETVGNNADFDGRGRIIIFFGQNQPPTDWIPGKYIGWTGVATGGGFVDSNVPDADNGGGPNSGYEIYSVFYSTIGQNWQVWVYWDRLAEGDPWTSGTSITTEFGADACDDAIIEGRRRRHEFNGVFDGENNPWDAIREVLFVARAVPIREGKRLSCTVAKPRAPVAIVNQATLGGGSFEWNYVDRTDRANYLFLEFHDRELGYDRSMEIVDDDIANDGSLSFTDIRRDTIFMRGITDRGEIARHGKFILNANRLLYREGKFTTGPDGLHLRAGDVVALSHDLVPWGVGGRLLADGTVTTITVDREITLQAGETYRVDVRDTFGSFETADISDGPGVYPSGSVLTLATALTFVPTKNSAYTIYKDSDRILAEITSARMLEDLTFEFGWTMYDEAIFDDDPGELEPASSFPANLETSQSPPPAPDSTTTIESAQNIDGGIVTFIRVTWGYTAEKKNVAGFQIMSAINAPEGGYEVTGFAPQYATSYDLAVPTAKPGDVVYVAVRPVNESGSGLAPHALPVSSTKIVGGVPGEGVRAPVRVSGTMVNDLASYAVQGSDASSHDVRRGEIGWILNHPIVTLPPGESSSLPTDDWGGAQTPTFLACRAKNASGMMSDRITGEFNPIVLTSQSMRQWSTSQVLYAAWGFSLPGVTLTGVQVGTDYAGRPYLELAPGFLEGTFETDPGELATDTSVDRDAYLDVVYEAVQDHPWSAGNWPAMNDPKMRRWTAEGPLYLTDDEEQCSIGVEVQFTTSGSLVPYQAFSPGLYPLSRAVWLLRLKRPSEDFNIRVYRFDVRARLALLREGSKRPALRWAETEM